MSMKKRAVPTARSFAPAGSLTQPRDGMWTLPRSTSTCPGQSNSRSSPTKGLQKNLFYMPESLSVRRKKCPVGSWFFNFLRNVYEIMKHIMDYKQYMDYVLQQILTVIDVTTVLFT